ncbi:putative RNA-directed DNA polymerase [Helianthus annuus]|nr:putative RNA-directed DNA polymerase [Helianthus annuus]KAJ0756042.1 putative RNA-directed DNA polymerase [Helianthus annuus]
MIECNDNKLVTHHTLPQKTGCDTTDHTSTSPTNPSQPSRRQSKPNPKYYNPNFINSTTLHPLPISLETSTHTQAMKDPEWRHAMDLEYNALIQNHTWELVPRTTQHPIGCKWVFRIKRKPDGTIDKYKARLVAKGFHQQYGKDYHDTFSPVTKPVTIRTVLSIALSKGWSLRQLDVNNAFLHGTLHEDVFMIQPPGFTNSKFPNHICKLKKSLYGLKQAPRAWYIELTTFLIGFGFKKCLSDTSLFVYNSNGITCYLLVYVDDIVLTGNHNPFMNSFVQAISNKFSIKDLGPLHHFLGIEVIPTPHGLFLSQHRHIQDVLTTFKMDGAKEVLTPLSVSDSLSSTDSSPPVDPTPYRKLVGTLQYLAFTRPDISFAINKLSQFMHSPKQSH